VVALDKKNIHLKRFKNTNATGKIIWRELKEAAFHSSVQLDAGHQGRTMSLESQDRQCTYDVILESVCAIIVAVGNH
jgi:hypothetical protein